jgi:hypothetical protein
MFRKDLLRLSDEKSNVDGVYLSYELQLPHFDPVMRGDVGERIYPQDVKFGEKVISFFVYLFFFFFFFFFCFTFWFKLTKNVGYKIRHIF